MGRSLALGALLALVAACSGAAPTPTQPSTGIPTGAAPTPTQPSTGIPTGAAPTPTQPSTGIATGGHSARASAASAVAVSPDGRWVVAANPDSDTVTIVDAISLVVAAEVPVGGDPRTVAITPDSRHALVVSRLSATVSAVDLGSLREVARWSVGPMPYGVATDGLRAYVTEFDLGHVAAIDLASGALVARVEVGAFPAGIAYRDGEVLVTHFFDGRVTGLDTEPLAVSRTARASADANLSQFVAHGDGARAYLPQTRSNATNAALVFDTTVFPVVNVLDLDRFAVVTRERITIDTADEPVDMPLAVAFGPGNKIYIANGGSDDVSVVDLTTGRGVAHLAVGANPRGIAVAPDRTRAFVNNTLDGTLSVIDTSADFVTHLVTLTEIPLDPQVLLGKRLFNSAEEPRLTADNWISCAVCHFDGTLDARTWVGFPDGPRNTPSLLGVVDTLPVHWSGDLNELADVELTVRNIQAGTGLTTGDTLDSLGPSYSGRSEDLDALVAYLETLEPPTSPYPGDTPETRRGAAVFEALSCQTCHQPTSFVDGELHDVGVGNPALERNSHGRGSMIDTPTLRGIWMTAPYFHDGSAATLKDVFGIGETHGIFDRVSPRELDDLIAYLFSLPE